ncbi:hypothetical protein BTO30_03785 [Domibacillus antri]|uniref:DUF2194 domain-containing protein n=1 Tax=Domibacillus antri TaxID=1714264 RepID=A0A1Q8Q887_9BACI|nr:DUF2194 domain-containing protein [Domibacillus antri]OLN23556.1 hypothetical protein BTO30_03785 [Domibacillus antri]
MNNRFNIEKSIYMMMIFVAIIGLFFMAIRSEYFVQYRHFSYTVEADPPEQSVDQLARSYEQPSFLMLVSPDYPDLAETLTSVIERLGKKVTKQSISEPLRLTSSYAGIIIATENIHAMPDVGAILTYAESGGSVFFAVRPSPGPALSALYQHLGMVETGTFIETGGIELAEPFFDSSFSKSFPSKRIQNSSLAVRLDNTASLYASSTDGTPLLWKIMHGSGRFIVFNGSMLADSSQSALFIKGMQLMVPHFIYPVMNAKVTALEGFPFPVPKGRHEIGNMTNEEFFRHTFWAGMQRLEAKFDLNYTASFVASFEDQQTKFNPYELSSAQENAIVYGRELLRMGGEVAVQGYNHLPIDGMNKSDVAILQQDTADRIAHALPGYSVRSYIPVEQENPFSHLSVIRTVFPDLRAVMAPVEEAFIQDDGLAVLPKTITGFDSTAYTDWLVFNELASSGFFSHSLMPQSFLYEDSFEESFQELTDFQKRLKKDVPWLRGLTLSNAARSLSNYTNTVVFEEKTGQGVAFHVNTLVFPAYFYFSTDQRITSTENCEVTKIGNNLYLIQAEDLTFKIGLDG